MTARPTGIIRTLPSREYGNDGPGRKAFETSIEGLKRSLIPAVYIAMAQLPTKEVLYMYLLVDGEIKVRMNIASYESGSAAECWDKTIRTPKYWALCTGPVSFPPEPMKRRGFQGIRYTEDLW